MNGLTQRTYRPISSLSVVSKVFEILINDRLVMHLEKAGVFSDFQYGFRSARSAADLLTCFDRKIARSLNSSGATLAISLVKGI